MTVEVERVGPDRRAEWNDIVERSPQAGAFHRFEALEALAAHGDATLHALVGYTGEEPVGVFPAFAVRKGLLRAVTSPPPALHVPYLGPALADTGALSRRKAERRHCRFVEAALAHVDGELAPRYVHFRTAPGYRDVRPYQWADFRVTPRHTYEVDLTAGEDALLSSFSSDARSNVRDADPDAYEIRVGGREAARRIVEQVRERLAAEDVPFTLPAGLAADLHDRLPAGSVRPYVCRVDGAVAGGILAVEDGDSVARWQGGVGGREVDLPVNDLLDWRVMTDAMGRGVDSYDLVGADTRRVNRYKAKFSPSLRTFHAMERGSTPVALLARSYRKFL